MIRARLGIPALGIVASVAPARAQIQKHLFLLLAAFLCSPPVLAQVQSVSVNKGSGYIQTGPNAGDVVPEPVSNNYGFGVDVDGNGIGGITAPTVTGPFNVGLIGALGHNGGTLVYSQGDRGWRYGQNGNDWGSPTLAASNSRFPDGTYVVTVSGNALTFNLTGQRFPNAPRLTLTGGTWTDGRYVVRPSQALTLTTNAFTDYGTAAESMICVAIVGGHFIKPFAEVAPQGCAWGLARKFATSTSGNTLSYTIPAGTLVNGQEYALGAIFDTMVQSVPHAGLPGSSNHATYHASTFVLLKAEEEPFSMTVTGSVTPTVANIIANILYRPADVGKTGSVYVFAVAPTSRVQMLALKDGIFPATAKAAPGFKDDPVPCTIAQLNSQGQLVQASASTMTAYSTGTLSAQGATINVLNNVATPNIAGATVYVGYGTSANAMLAEGLTRNAVAVAGTTECRPAPPQPGWWWNKAEGGRGYSIESQGRNLFMAAYLYDASGRATWLVASGPTSVDGSIFTAPLYGCSGGVTLSGAYRANSCAQNGEVLLTFNDLAHGRMVWPGGSIPIERFDTVPGGLTATPINNQPENGWWWNAAENGRGFFIEWQGASATIAGYMYDDPGNPIWYIAVTPITNALAQNGTWLQFSGGQTLTGTYRAPNQVTPGPGPLAISFQSATTATMTMPGGRQVPLTRFRF